MSNYRNNTTYRHKLTEDIKQDDSNNNNNNNNNNACPSHEGILKRGVVGLLISNLGARWFFWSTSRPDRVYPNEGTPVLIEQEAGWTQQPVWTFLEKRRR